MKKCKKRNKTENIKFKKEIEMDNEKEKERNRNTNKKKKENDTCAWTPNILFKGFVARYLRELGFGT